MADSTLTFGSPADLGAEFGTTVTVFGILILVIVVGLALRGRGSPGAVTFKTRCILGLLGLMGVIWYAYASTYQHFVTADVNGDQVRLVFVGPFAREVILPRGKISAVRWGVGDRGAAKCRVSIEVESSSVYYSAWLRTKPAICKGLRDDILHTLQLDRTSNSIN